MGAPLVPGLGIAAAWRATPLAAPRGVLPRRLVPHLSARLSSQRLDAPRSRAAARALPVDGELRRRAGLDGRDAGNGDWLRRVGGSPSSDPAPRGRSRSRASTPRSRSSEPRRANTSRGGSAPRNVGSVGAPLPFSAPPLRSAPSALVRALAVAGAASRRASERLIRAGRVTVNGAVELDPAVPVVAGRDAVALDGLAVALVAERGPGEGGGAREAHPEASRRGRAALDARGARSPALAFGEYFEDDVINDFAAVRERRRRGRGQGGGRGAAGSSADDVSPPPSRWLGASALSLLEDASARERKLPRGALGSARAALSDSADGGAGADSKVLFGQGGVDGSPASRACACALVRPAAHVYFMLHKPKGFACTASLGAETQPMALSLLDGWVDRRLKAYREAGVSPPFLRLFTVGRLDAQTSGLLFVTSDGEWANRLLHPSNMILRTYSCTLSSRPTKAQLSRLLDLAAARGAEVAPVPGPSRASAARASALRVSIRKGENREVRRLLQSADLDLRNLKRVAFGASALPRGLAAGTARQLQPREAWGVFARGVGEAKAYARAMQRDHWDERADE